jgi:hypothetical protein
MLQNLYYSPNIRMIKSRISWADHVSDIGKITNKTGLKESGWKTYTFRGATG